jgi:hypothetical protein
LIRYNTDENDPRHFYFVAIASIPIQDMGNGFRIEKEVRGLLLQSIPSNLKNSFSEEVFQRVGLVVFEGECVHNIIAMKERRDIRKVILV